MQAEEDTKEAVEARLKSDENAAQSEASARMSTAASEAAMKAALAQLDTLKERLSVTQSGRGAQNCSLHARLLAAIILLWYQYM